MRPTSLPSSVQNYKDNEVLFSASLTESGTELQLTRS